MKLQFLTQEAVDRLESAVSGKFIELPRWSDRQFSTNISHSRVQNRGRAGSNVA